MTKYSVVVFSLALCLNADIKASEVYPAEFSGVRYGVLENSRSTMPAPVKLIINTTSDSLEEAKRIFNKTSYGGMIYSFDTDSYEQLIKSTIRSIELLLLGKYDRIAIDVNATASSETPPQKIYRLAREYLVIKHMQQLIEHSATKKQGWFDWAGYKTSRTRAFRFALYQATKNDWNIIDEIYVDNKLYPIQVRDNFREQENAHLKELTRLLTAPSHGRY